MIFFIKVDKKKFYFSQHYVCAGTDKSIVIKYLKDNILMKKIYECALVLSKINQNPKEKNKQIHKR